MEHSILQPGLNFAPCESRRWSQPQRSSPAVSGNEALIHGTRQDWRYHTPSVPIFEISTTMTVSWISWASLFFICLLPCTMGVTNQFQLEPMTAAVLKGSDAQFIARVTGSWTIMTWIVGGFLVLTLNGNTTISLSEQYSATFCSSDNSSCVEFTIHNISRSLSGPVTCAVQGLFGEKTAQLYVQEKGMISITGPSMKVMYDQQVEFQCVTAGWYPKPTVTWTLYGNAMNSTLDNFTDNGDFFNSTSVLTFQAVRDTTVKCLVSIPALTSPQSTSLSLVVAPNWTVLIAVVVSFGSLALLVLLIIGIWFFYKRRKEKQTNYQDEMRRVRTQSQLSGVHGPRNKEGQVNTTYVPEGQTSVPTSEITDNGVFQVSTVANSAQAGVYNFEDPGFMKHRHVTIV